MSRTDQGSLLQQLANGYKIYATEFRVYMKHPDQKFEREIIWQALNDYLQRGWVSKESDVKGLKAYSLTSAGWNAVRREQESRSNE